MTSFSTPFSRLPNSGFVQRPDPSATEYQDALTGLALIDDGEARQEAATTHARHAHDRLNAQLRATAEQVRRSLGVADDTSSTAIERHRQGLADEDDVKSVISTDQLVPRDWMARFMMIFMTVIVVGLYLFADAKLLGQVVITSGVLGLLPGSYWDMVFAYVFAGAPLAWAAWKYSSHQRLKTAREQGENLRGINQMVKRIGIPSWIAAVVVMFGPHLVQGGGALEDPFAERPGWAETISVVMREMQKILQDLSGLMSLLLLVGVLIGVSNTIAAIWIAHRETYSRAKREHVRPAEEAAFREQELDRLINDEVETALSIGRLDGLIQEIDADREASAAQFSHEVEALRARGDGASRAAILERSGASGEVVNAGPLFSRR